jgi:hypothetical protein
VSSVHTQSLAPPVAFSMCPDRLTPRTFCCALYRSRSSGLLAQDARPCAPSRLHVLSCPLCMRCCSRLPFLLTSSHSRLPFRSTTLDRLVSSRTTLVRGARPTARVLHMLPAARACCHVLYARAATSNRLVCLYPTLASAVGARPLAWPHATVVHGAALDLLSACTQRSSIVHAQPLTSSVLFSRSHTPSRPLSMRCRSGPPCLLALASAVRT